MWGGGVCFSIFPLSDLDFSKLKMNHISNSYEAHFVQLWINYGARFPEDSKGGLWPRVSGVNFLEFSGIFCFFQKFLGCYLCNQKQNHKSKNKREARIEHKATQPKLLFWNLGSLNRGGAS